MVVRLNVKAPVDSGELIAPAVERVDGREGAAASGDQYQGVRRGLVRRVNDPLAPRETEASPGSEVYARNRVPETIMRRVAADRAAGRSGAELARGLALQFPLSANRGEDIAIYRYVDAMHSTPSDAAPGVSVTAGDVAPSSAHAPARTTAEQDTINQVLATDARMRNAPPEERERYYRSLATQDIASLRITTGETHLRDQQAGGPVSYDGLSGTSFTIGELATIRLDRAELERAGVRAEDPESAVRYLQAFRAQQEARGLDAGVVDGHVLDAYQRYLQAFFVHHGNGVDYAGTPAERVERLPELIAAMRTGSLDRRMLDCEGFHYLSQRVLRPLGYQTETVALPSHVATFVQGREGASFVVDNQRVRAVVDHPNALGQVLGRGVAVAYSRSPTQDDPNVARFMWMPGHDVRPQTDAEALVYDLRERMLGGYHATEDTARWESYFGIRQDLRLPL
ncbi:MAG: hypothetical protein ACAI38_12160 [Myxococcota bacterium]